MRITRLEEMEMPNFESHVLAREYFIKRYGEENFKLRGEDELDGTKIYYYELDNQQPVEIFENGEVHIVY